MKFLVYGSIGVATLWLQLTVAPLLAVFGIMPNLLLISVAVLGLRWMEPWLFLYAVFAGLALDAFSHGQLGVYALSLYATSFAARLIGASVYENSLLVGVLAVLGLSLLDGFVAVTVLQWMDDGVPWWHWMLTGVLPGALVNALWSPLLFFALGRLERWVRPLEA